MLGVSVTEISEKQDSEGTLEGEEKRKMKRLR
jgi:hypothetical protein